MIALGMSSSTVFCPLTRHCENARISLAQGKSKCKNNLRNCDHPLMAHDGMYLGKNTTRPECVATT
jgi:hypothetical protein